ncbi:hypothetical protein SLEP1_g12390 [Rubroshorea leprosula]|uniref:Uncharacterized protein n=1 Tax=Rubroshorea leprosula TaxID=152421 RepID=A0AAV5IN22_9ROSI|nr:hypothetical protein SLEP1_g12390 [Rubroshorea leprosula]
MDSGDEITGLLDAEESRLSKEDEFPFSSLGVFSFEYFAFYVISFPFFNLIPESERSPLLNFWQLIPFLFSTFHISL